MFNVFLFVCLDELPGEKRSGASESSKPTREIGLDLKLFRSGLRRSVNYVTVLVCRLFVCLRPRPHVILSETVKC